MKKQEQRKGVEFCKITNPRFRRLMTEGQLVPFRIYFVGDATTDAEGFCDSERGEIHVAISKDKSVRFVNLTREELNEALEETKKWMIRKKNYDRDFLEKRIDYNWKQSQVNGLVQFFSSEAKFPSVGTVGVLYVSESTHLIYSYSSTVSGYVLVGGSSVQSDWNQADTTAPDYIKNKPTAMKNPYSFAIGGKTYDGSAYVSVSLTDLDVYSKSESDGRFVKQHVDGSPTGDITKPVFVDASGRVAECYQYAGGSCITLNGTQLLGNSASCYAPINRGTAGQYLTPADANQVYPSPEWETPDSTPTQSSTKLITSDGVYQALQALALSDTAVAGKFVTEVDETGGVVSVTRGGSETLNNASLYELSGNSDDLNVIVGFGGNYADKTFKKIGLQYLLRLLNEKNEKNGLLTITDSNWRMYLKKWSGNTSNLNEWSDTASEPYECNVLLIPNTDIHTIKIETTAMIDPTQGFPTPIKLERVVMPSGDFETLNNYRITIFGNWQPSTNGYWGMSNADGRFSNYVYMYRFGVQGGSNFDGCMWYGFEDFLYFNGVWYSKGY